MTAFAAHPALRRYWHAVAPAVAAADEPLAVRLLGEDLVVWRAGPDTLGVLRDRCPHREAPLSAGRVDGGCVECPYHGWRFDASGACRLVPSAGGGGAVPSRAAVPAYRAVERYGLVWVCLDEPAAPPPSVPEDDDPSFRRINPPVDVWRAAATRMVDNFLDIAHFPFVHRASFGGAAAAEVPAVELGDLGGWFGYRYAVTAANPEAGAAASGASAAVVHREMSTGFTLPFAVRSTIRYDSGLQHVLLLLSTPRDDESSYFAFVVWRNDDASVPAEEVIRLDLLIGEEDRRMLERVPGTLALERNALVNVQADRASVEWRRRLRELLGPPSGG